MSSPADGSRIEGSLLELRGSSENLVELRVGSQNISLSTDGSWSSRLTLEPGLQNVQLRGLSLNGSSLVEERLVLMGEGRHPEAPVAEGVVLVISKAGLSRISDAISPQLEPETLEREIKKKGALYTGKIGIKNLLEARVTVTLDSLGFESREVFIQPSKGKLKLEISLHKLDVLNRLRIQIYGTTTQATMSMRAEDAVISCTLKPRIRDGLLKIEVHDAQVEFTQFEPALSGLPPGLEPKAVRREIRLALEEELKKALVTNLPAQINPTLAQLSQDQRILLGSDELTLTVRPVRVQIDAHGAQLAFSQDLNSSHAPDAPSVLALTHRPPPLDPSLDMSLSIADDLANLLLYEAWANNALTLNLSTKEGTLDPAILSVLKSESASIQAFLSLPPVLVGSGSGVQLQAGPIQARMLSPGSTLGSFLDLELVLWVDLELYAEDQNLRLRSTQVESQIEVIGHDWAIPGPLIEGTLRGFLDLEDRINQGLEKLVIPLPEVPGLDLSEPFFDRSPEGGYSRGSIEFP